MGSDNNTKDNPSWDTKYHVSRPDSQLENSPQGRVYERENVRKGECKEIDKMY